MYCVSSYGVSGLSYFTQSKCLDMRQTLETAKRFAAEILTTEERLNQKIREIDLALNTKGCGGAYVIPGSLPNSTCEPTSLPVPLDPTPNYPM
jgi:hypothetical protein